MTKPYHRSRLRGVRLYKTKANGAGGSPGTQVAFTTVGNWTDSADGVTNPNWKDRIADSVDATTPFSARRIDVKLVEGQLLAKGWANGVKTDVNKRQCFNIGTLDHHTYTSLTATNSSIQQALSRADSQFFEEAHKAVTAIEGGELLGELGETVHEIKRLAGNMASLLFDWKRQMRFFRGRRGRNAAGLIADSYLRWKFGWDPFVKDMQALAGGLKNDFFDVIPINVHGKGLTCESQDTTEFTDNVNLRVQTSVRRTETSQIRYKAGIKVTRYGVRGLADTLGLSPRNFLPTVYNLLPWTYMIDYFSNAGSIVSAIAFDLARVSWCNRTIRQQVTVETVTGLNPRPPVGVDWIDEVGYPIVVPSKNTWVLTNVSRSNARPELPRLYLKLPNFQSIGGRIQGANIAAVLAALTWSKHHVPSSH